MGELPAPLTAADCDLSDYRFMPLDVGRLRKSKAWLMAKRNPALAFYMINLWTASWHEMPAASLEDDDDILADAAMCDIRKWPSVRDQVLRGWIKCSDGRLYHPVVAEKAIESFAKKKTQTQRTKNARAAAMRARQEQAAALSQTAEQVTAELAAISATASVTMSVTDLVADSATETKGREGKGREGKEGAKPLAFGTQAARAEELASASVAKERARWERLGLKWEDDPKPLVSADPLHTGMADITPHPKDGRPTCNGYYVDSLFEDCCEAAGIRTATSLASWKPLVEWLKEGYEEWQIMRIIRQIADRPGYEPPRTLGYFTKVLHDEGRVGAQP